LALESRRSASQLSVCSIFVLLTIQLFNLTTTIFLFSKISCHNLIFNSEAVRASTGTGTEFQTEKGIAKWLNNSADRGGGREARRLLKLQQNVVASN
jgi:hypothetical protein